MARYSHKIVRTFGRVAVSTTRAGGMGGWGGEGCKAQPAAASASKHKATETRTKQGKGSTNHAEGSERLAKQKTKGDMPSFMLARCSRGRFLSLFITRRHKQKRSR